MPNPRQYRSVSDAIAAQSVGDEAARLILQTWSRRLKKRLAALPFRLPCTKMSSTTPRWSTARHRSVQHAPDRDERLIEMPRYRPAAVGAGTAVCGTRHQTFDTNAEYSRGSRQARDPH